MSRKINIGIIQTNVKTASVKTNREKLIKLFRKNAKEGADIVCFPEMMTTGYCSKVINNINNLAEDINGETVRLFKNEAKK